MESLAKYIDHTFLGQAGSRDAVRRLCREAAKFGFASVCVNPAEVALAARLLEGSDVKVCTVVGFPLGQSTTAAKVAEALDAIRNGARELDFVVNVRLLKYEPGACLAELKELVGSVAAADPGVVTKLIIECCLLTDAEKRRACRLAKKAGFGFVKTSTGFSSGGATVEDVRLMRKAVGRRMGVKAAGGIRDREKALAMIDAGANRIGSSAGVAICGGGAR
ncbi:MAG: deoxyribose-phosphate aldolase [Kiritimatiellae bacterium]|nr:deoxyribose-phosphate aldolase [Kiritimatiellia bacterium]